MSSTSASTATNARFELWDAGTNTLLSSQVLQAGGTTNTGWKFFSGVFPVAGVSSVRIRIYTWDWWIANRNKELRIDQVEVRCNIFPMFWERWDVMLREDEQILQIHFAITQEIAENGSPVANGFVEVYSEEGWVPVGSLPVHTRRGELRIPLSELKPLFQGRIPDVLAVRGVLRLTDGTLVPSPVREVFWNPTRSPVIHSAWLDARNHQMVLVVSTHTPFQGRIILLGQDGKELWKSSLHFSPGLRRSVQVFPVSPSLSCPASAVYVLRIQGTGPDLTFRTRSLIMPCIY